MMSGKLATVGLFKIKAFWYKGCDLIISVHDAIKRILSPDSNHFVNVVMWPKFGNSSVTVREVIITLILLALDQKNLFFWGDSWFKFNNLGLALGIALKFYTSVAKELKLKVRTFLGLIPTFGEVTWEKMVMWPF